MMLYPFGWVLQMKIFFSDRFKANKQTRSNSVITLDTKLKPLLLFLSRLRTAVQLRLRLTQKTEEEIILFQLLKLNNKIARIQMVLELSA